MVNIWFLRNIYLLMCLSRGFRSLGVLLLFWEVTILEEKNQQLLFTRFLPSLNVIRFVTFFYVRFKDQCLRSKASFIFNMLEFCWFVCVYTCVYLCHPRLYFTVGEWCTHAWVEVRGQRVGAGFLSIVWVLGIRLKLSDLTASDSTHWVIWSTPGFIFKETRFIYLTVA